MSKKYHTKKRFGQHFLHDPHIIQKIISAITPQKKDVIVEIGPGLGALSFPLLKYVSELDVIEIDRDIVQRLQAKNKQQLRIHNVDVLQFNFSTLQKSTNTNNKLRIIGNLPYNISTPVIFHLLNYREHIKDMHFMLQKEVVDRLTASLGNKNYGRLSIMVQYFCKTKYLFHVSPNAFSPPPKVDSAVLRITPWDNLPFKAKNPEFLSKLVKEAFSKRRKTLRNALKNLLSSEQIKTTGIDPNLRPEQIDIEGFVNLSNLL